MSRSFGSPGRYVQRRGEISRLGEHLADLGRQPLFLVDAFLYDRYAESLGKGLGSDFQCRFEKFGGECSDREIARVTKIASDHGADVIVGIGGGKTLDTAKMAAHRTNARMLAVPSIASTDAPTSAVVVVYTDEGVLQEAHNLPRNPDLVLVDPDVIVAAPVRFLMAGVGDALATWYEARANFDAGTLNYISGGFPATRAALAIARECHAVILEQALMAKQAAEAGVVTRAVEDIIEANTLLSGLGFENCGVSAAHGIHDALTVLPEIHGVLHGEKVIFGVLCLLVLENRPQAEIEETLRFCRSLGLPITLADLNIKEDVRAKVRRVAEAAVKGKITHATRAPVGVEEIEAAILAADALGRAA
ncbi:glycerol dehydrogenase [Shinella daejeonensis]|uniref:glycerol dehydrogenase n=1 Tax=Shinella daejeonensis TaxID=659017 RepID=UPI0020C76334|nr:glycerol dehydrogenase [Shinella daejeonensis]MCP8894807.1 glycerol dehydrogenase [Shinella daejeonensis]